MILIDNIIGKCDNSIIREVLEKERNKGAGAFHSASQSKEG